MRLAVVTSHPIQYQAPLLRRLAQTLDTHVYFGHRATSQDQSSAGFGVAFQWDFDLLEGYSHEFLRNVSARPDPSQFLGIDTPDLAARIASRMPDALLVMGWHSKSYWQAIWAARRLHIPVMVRGDSHLDTPRRLSVRALKSAIYPPALRVFSAALYVGHRSRAYYERYGFPRDRLVYSPHCVDNARFAAGATATAREAVRRRHGIGADVPLALLCGKLIPLKRPLDLIDAAALCRANGAKVEVMVAGAGEMESAVVERARERAVPLHMLGFRNQSKMPEVYSACDFLVLPSQSETWGLVANEALACGRPVIVSDVCGCAPDLAADGKAGRMFPVRDVAALAAAIDALSRTPCRPRDLAARSASYNIDVAVEGIRSAAELVMH